MQQIENFFRYLASRTDAAATLDATRGQDVETYASIVKAGAVAGFLFSEAELREWLEAEFEKLHRLGELSDIDLESMSGGTVWWQSLPPGMVDSLRPGQINAILAGEGRKNPIIGQHDPRPAPF